MANSDGDWMSWRLWFNIARNVKSLPGCWSVGGECEFNRGKALLLILSIYRPFPPSSLSSCIFLLSTFSTIYLSLVNHPSSVVCHFQRTTINPGLRNSLAHHLILCVRTTHFLLLPKNKSQCLLHSTARHAVAVSVSPRQPTHNYHHQRHSHRRRRTEGE